MDLTRTLELLRRSQDGDRTALNTLFVRYYDRVRRIVRLRLGPRLRSRVDSGDVLQETFLAALKAFDRFEVREEAEFLHWVSRIAEHQICRLADYHRAEKRTSAKEIPLEGGEDPPHPPEGLRAHDTLPLDAVDRSEQTARLETCLADLPEEYKELILLRDYEGASWEAIARQTGCPSPDAARMKHATAVVQLARRMRGPSCT